MPDTETVDPTDPAYDQVERLLSGDQQREPSIPSTATLGEGEHQMKGTYANVNPVAVGEAEDFLARQTLKARAARDDYPAQVIPRESVVKSGTNKFTDIALANDTRVAGGREVGQFSEALGITRSDSDGRFVDPQKVDPTTGIAYTNEQGGTVVLNADGSQAISLDPLVAEAEITPDPEADDDIEAHDLPDGVDATDPQDKVAVPADEIPIGGFRYPLKTDGNGQPILGEDGQPIVVYGDEEGSAVDVDHLDVIDALREDDLNLTREQIGEGNIVQIDQQANVTPEDPAAPSEVTTEETNPPVTSPALENLPPADEIPTTGAPDPALVDAGATGTDAPAAGAPEDKDASNQSGGTWVAEDYTAAELEAACKERGLSASGTKAEMVDRLNGV